MSEGRGAAAGTAREHAARWAAARARRVHAGGRVRLGPEDIARLGSSYLARGYTEDAVAVREIVLTYPRATATVDVTAFTMPSNGHYHFTALHAMLCVCQVGIVAGTVAHGLRAKPGELYLRDFAIVCRREIRETRGLRLVCEVLRAQPTADQMLYAIAFEYCERAFSGTLRCLFPRHAAGAGA